METFEVLDVSGDVGIRAHGETIEEAFTSALMGMYSLSADIETIEEKRAVDVSVEGDTLEGLLVAWLNELIFHTDAYGFIGKRVVITEFSPSLAVPPRGGGTDDGRAYRIKAVIYGEEFDPGRHDGKLLIKAATYHRLKIEKKDDLWEIDVIFDI